MVNLFPNRIFDIPRNTRARKKSGIICEITYEIEVVKLKNSEMINVVAYTNWASKTFFNVSKIITIVKIDWAKTTNHRLWARLMCLIKSP